MQFIDTHCHIIPGVDDGPSDTGESLEMGRIAVRDGISTIVATPHVVEGFYLGADRKERLNRLRSLFLSGNIDLELVSGAEVPISLCTSGDKELLRELSVGGRYLLVETSETSLDQLARAIYRVRLCSLYPVLAHPERFSIAQEHKAELASLLEQNDTFVQVTAAAIDGLFGKGPRKAWEQMAKAGLVHLIGTDAHSAGMRAPRLSASYEKLKRLAGDDAARTIMLDNPARLLAGEKLATAPSSARFWDRRPGQGK